MTRYADLTAAVIGTGFIGTVHVQALRRIGVRVAGVLGSSATRGQERAEAIGVGHAYPSLDALLSDDAVDLVHVTSPNDAHYEHVKAILAAGKHVICEKPLAMTSAQSAEMVALAEGSGKVCAVCYNTRFYPLNQHAHAMVREGGIGDVRLVSGRYHQDWLAKATDWNWRLESERGGALRSVGDIGTHWLDLTGFVTGLRPEAVMADLATMIEERQRPSGPVETFSSAVGETETVRVDTDDAATILLRYEGGARGVVSTSQVSPGRKNTLEWDVAGENASLAWQSETPDHLFIGHRDAPNQTLMRDVTLMNATGTAAAQLPPGHVEGFADTFSTLFRAVYADVAAGGRSKASTWATFADGHLEMVLCDAILASAREERWVRLAEIEAGLSADAMGGTT
ncbi:MAG: Gfo/Idh/MocA family oxidoreductase [Pseudomonadota bacterium]